MFKSRRGKNKNLTALKSNSNTVWFNFQTYIIFSINLVSLVTLRSSGTDIKKRSFNNRSVTFSRKANLGIYVRHVYKRV
jgi:hypothetical protein